MKYFAFVLLLLVCCFSIYLLIFNHFLFLFSTVASLYGLSSIKFKVLKLNEQSIDIEYKGLIHQLDRHESFEFNNIESISFRKGLVDKKFLLFDIFFNTGGFRGNSRPTYILIRMKNKEENYIMKMGRLQVFEEFYSELSNQFNKR